MIRRTAWWLLRWLAGFAAGLTLAAAFLVWRLSVAPVSLDYLVPSVARALAETESGLVVRIDHTLLSLGPGATIEIVARGVASRPARWRGAAYPAGTRYRLQSARRAAGHRGADRDRAARAGAAAGARRRRHRPSRPWCRRARHGRLGRAAAARPCRRARPGGAARLSHAGGDPQRRAHRRRPRAGPGLACPARRRDAAARQPWRLR